MWLGERFRGSEVLITGGLGFIGSNLALQLVDGGARLVLLDSLDERFGGNWANIEPIRSAAEVVIADLRDPNVASAVVGGKQFIFHLAGQVSHAASMRDPLGDWEVNGLATLNLVEACRQHNREARIVFTSTRQVYGVARVLPVAETNPTAPPDINGIHKLAAEHYLQLYQRVYGIRSTILRLTNTYGPRQKICCSGQGCAGYFVFQALRGEPIRLYGGGSQRRDFNYVDDVVQALLLAATTDECAGGVFNLGGEQAYSLREYVDALREFCRFEIEPIPFPAGAQAIDVGDYQGDFARLHRMTGWAPRTELRQGLAQTIEFFRAHPRPYGLCHSPN